jgi:hypothetical protein
MCVYVCVCLTFYFHSTSTLLPLYLYSTHTLPSLYLYSTFPLPSGFGAAPAAMGGFGAQPQAGMSSNSPVATKSPQFHIPTAAAAGGGSGDLSITYP